MGSRSRLQDVPKIAQMVESRLHRWFDERAVEPRFQEIALPSLWPRKRNTRGGDEALDVIATSASSVSSGSAGKGKGREIARELKEEARKEVRAEAAAGQRRDIRERELSPPENLRYRRPRGQRDGSAISEFSMPGSLPGMAIDLPT